MHHERAFVDKSGHRARGRPGARLTSRGSYSIALVQRSSQYRIACPAQLIFDFLASRTSLFGNIASQKDRQTDRQTDRKSGDTAMKK
ncbi:hypothetical protein V3C99_019019 [Haemonchus contortus]|uniref:DUF1534 domain-containing protein n=1 Tax=Haemonchus contortus TaxID=6289 RepID=A0A7I4Z0H6_HAECO